MNNNCKMNDDECAPTAVVSNSSNSASPYLTAKNQTNTIELEPFIHQVGGRSAILVLGDCICKPVNDRELAFYESIERFAPRLKQFVPQFHGVILVDISEGNDGYLIISTKSLKQNQQQEREGPLQHDLLSANVDQSTGNNGTHFQSHQLQSPNSPYQKFVTKYRVRLSRPLRQVIIESHEEDVPPNDVSLDLECSKKQLESLLLSKSLTASSGKKFETTLVNHNCAASANNASNIGNSSANIGVVGSQATSPSSLNFSASSLSTLSRSRSTSISIPNFEDAGTNGFDNSGNGNNRSSSRSSSVCNVNHYSPISPRSPRISQNVEPSFSANILSRQSSLSSGNKWSTTKHNPWVLKTFSTLSEFETMKEQRFILLENLAANFEFPCIMDLKMGTRLHDDNATETKKQSHESKVNETTSGTLGLRITGIQIYDKVLDRFICYNKYYGRKLTPEGFRESLKKFVSNANFVAHNLLGELIKKLRQLRAVVVQLDTFRFYTSSLLLIYEGNACKGSYENDGENISEASSTTTQRCNSETHDPNKSLIDVRIIDFAHSSHGHLSVNEATTEIGAATASTISNFSDEIKPAQQPDYDEGFVFGLDNLIKILTLFQNE